jgi:hypothetical protein
MNHWPFIAASYVLTLMAVASVLVASWRTMRAAEARADGLERKR